MYTCNLSHSVNGNFGANLSNMTRHLSKNYKEKLKEHIYTYLVIFLLDEIKYSDESNLREKGFIPVQLTVQGTQSILLGESGQQELQGVGHMTPKVKKQRALDARNLMLAFMMQSRTLALGMVLPTIKPGLQAAHL